MLRWLERYAAPRPVTGIDFDDSAVAHARGQGRGLVARGSALALPFRPASFELVHCADVLQHLPTLGGDATALAECARVLAPGGLLLLRTNATPGLGAAGDDPNYQRYQLSILEAGMVAAGFTVLRSTHVNVLPSLVATARRAAGGAPAQADGHLHRYAPGLPRMPRLPGLNRALAGLLAAEAVLLSLPRVASPFGHSTLVLARRV
jgi:SAM-dependent methyltransferase